MREIVLIIALCLSSIGFSQVNKGAIIIGGNFNVSERKNTTNNPYINTFSDKETSIFINLKLGFYIHKNIIKGIGFAFEKFINNTNQNLGGEQKITARVNYLNPFVNIQSELTSKLKFNLRVNYNYGKGKVERTGYTNDYESKNKRI